MEMDSLANTEPDSSSTDSLVYEAPEKGSEAWLEALWTALVSEEDSLIEWAASEMSKRQNPDDYDILKGLFNGVLYVYPEQEDFKGLVLLGEERDTDDGFTEAPLFTPHPQKKPILDENNKQIYLDPNDLTEVDCSRNMRIFIQTYLDKMDLFHADPNIRKIAAENIGNKGDPLNIALLESSLKNETDNSILSLKKVSIAKLKLKFGSPIERLTAANNLADLKSPLGIPALKSRIEKNESGQMPEKDERVIKAVEDALASLKSFRGLMDFIQTSFIGISLGSILILVALGLAIIYGLMGIINMAHGEFMMIGAYTTFVVQNICMKHLSPENVDWFFPLSLPFAFVVAGLFGVAMEWLVIRHLYKKPLESLLATWGISLCLIQLARNIFGDLTAVQLPKALSGGLEIAPQVLLPFNRIFIIGLTIVTVLILYTIFYKTKFGLKLRAVTQNRPMSSCVGISVRRIDAMTFFLGTGIAGVAGWAMTLIGNVVPNMGETYIVDSFLVVVTGGVGKLMGTIWAGLGIGVINKILEPIFEAVYAKVFILGIIILFLQARPTGIFPSKGRNADE